MEKIMNKILLIATICSVSSLSTAASIGENYEEGGFIVNGYASISSNESRTRLYSSGGAAFLVAEGISIGFGSGLNHSNYKDSDMTSTTFSLNTSLAYTFGYDPLAETGLAYTAGFSGYLSKYSSGDVKYDANLGLSPYFKVDYFLTPRISVYGLTQPIDINLTAGDGEDFFDAEFALSMGISYSFANKDIKWDNVTK